MKRTRLLIYALCFIWGIYGLLANQEVFSAGKGKTVTFIPVEHEVERGLEAFLERNIKKAETDGTDHIVLEIYTPGGRVDAAIHIAKLMRETDIPITAYIVKNAFSAGAYIALNADEIVMKPSTTIGSAAVIDSQGNTAGQKAESAWKAEMLAAAELNDRDPLYAEAMVDPDVEIPALGLKKEKLLTLTASEAVKVGYAEKIVEDRQELLAYLNLEEAKVVESEPTFADKIARFVTNPVIVPILLSLGSLGLVLELYTPGFGIAGSIGALSLFLFFYGHMIAGLAGWEAIILFVIGFILIILELFLPGGIIGIIGVIAMLTGLILAGGSGILLAIAIAIIITIIGSYFFIRSFGYNGPLKRLVLFDSTSSEKGYLSHSERIDLTGKTGISATPLRPAGSVKIDDEYIDVVSEGSFIGKGEKVKIVKVSGGRVVVRLAENNE
ncbi:NfeD family protein [Fictibacillus phosphorivorans]|uniref:NfeD family protein n=1 Tax=Fictibacillus phosphorivorans TaxID=1221500 RepID=UPI002040CFC8|nr:nodulation protein NfeD [Fictibacillus phosphorivorans]MCM3716872.1 nodulation protein NfeD [Fictibacillus phosphorivorans]MCM3774579.1 nodulation protein NfeD [Fictibacillus phosphorivorans]